MSVPVFITCRDRVNCLRLLLDRLESIEAIGRIVLVDNDSAWPPMVDFLEQTRHEVVRLPGNFGHRSIWLQRVHESLRTSGPFIVTDPDVLPDDGCPPDLISRLSELLDAYPSIVKAGLGLRIDDLPHGSSRAEDIRVWESQFWEREIDHGVFDAPVDTTFALYRAGAGPDHAPAVRTGTPYVARHVPWYADLSEPDPEETFYRARARQDSTNWHHGTLEPDLAAALERRRRNLNGQPDHPLLDAWAAEPDLVDETDFTPWAEPGWNSWNGMSAEREFSEFAGLLARLMQPGLVVETGVGQGYSTRRIASGLGNGTQLCFESDPDIRAGLSSLSFFDSPRHVLSSYPAPSLADFARADLTVLDSEPPGRYAELRDWRAAATEGSVLLVHDCGNNHPEGTLHNELRQIIMEFDVPGVFFKNPRGAFLGLHPGKNGSPVELQSELVATRQKAETSALDARAAHEEMARMRSTWSWRLTRPLRAVQGRRLRRKSVQRLPDDGS